MAEYKLVLKKRELVGKKTKILRKEGLIPSVVYGGKDPELFSSDYNETEKVLNGAGYHSPIDLDMDGKKQMAIVKEAQIDPISRKIINVEFQAISADKVVEATTPIVIVNFESSEASKIYHFAMTQALEEIDVKARPADLPKSLEIDASDMKSLDDKITIADIKLPKGVEFADKELHQDQVVASLYDVAAEAAAREAEESVVEEEPASEATSSDSGEKPAETE